MRSHKHGHQTATIWPLWDIIHTNGLTPPAMRHAPHGAPSQRYCRCFVSHYPACMLWSIPGHSRLAHCRGPHLEVNQPGGRPTPLWYVGPSPALGWVLTWCRGVMCWGWHVGTLVWSLMGPWIYVNWSWAIERKQCIQGLRITLGLVTWFMGAWGSCGTHRRGRVLLGHISPFCSVLQRNTSRTCRTCYLVKYAYDMLIFLFSKAIDGVRICGIILQA